MTLSLIPCTIKKANVFISEHHRHHKPVHGALWAVACTDDGEKLCGVAVIGRPVARLLDDGQTCEVVRLATDGARNACSMLYGAAARAAKALGYRRIITYTLQSEEGASLRGAGWILDGVKGGGEWDRKNRPRQRGLFPTEAKKRWSVSFGGAQ